MLVSFPSERPQRYRRPSVSSASLGHTAQRHGRDEPYVWSGADNSVTDGA